MSNEKVGYIAEQIVALHKALVPDAMPFNVEGSIGNSSNEDYYDHLEDVKYALVLAIFKIVKAAGSSGVSLLRLERFAFFTPLDILKHNPWIIEICAKINSNSDDPADQLKDASPISITFTKMPKRQDREHYWDISGSRLASHLLHKRGLKYDARLFWKDPTLSADDAYNKFLHDTLDEDDEEDDEQVNE